MILTFLDIETTGFNFLESDILQVGFVRANEKGELINAGNLYYYQPEFNVEQPDAQAVHGITREFLLPYEEDFNKNCAGLWSLMQNGYIVGKNSKVFDIPFITGWLIQKFPGMLPPIKLFRTCDVQDVCKSYFQNDYYLKNGCETKRKGTLEDYVAMLDIEDKVETMYKRAQAMCSEKAREGYHDALFDATATYCVWLEARAKNWCDV